MRFKKRRRRVFIAEADSHAGHKLGLCNPDAMLMGDNGEDIGVNLGEFQKYLWGLRVGYFNSAVDLANGCEIIHSHVGDITQGQRHKAALMTTGIDDQFSIAAANIRPVYQLPNVKRGRISSGTASHIFFEATSEKNVVRLLRAEFPKKDIKLQAHALIDIGGVGFDIAHHGPGAGIRQWTRGNQARYYLRSLMYQDFKSGNRPAHVYMRAHYHTFVHETLREKFLGEWYECHLIILPSWCGMTEHGRQATKSQFEVTNGLLVFEIIPGDQIPLRVHPMTKTLDLRTKETL
jgi:hypothetical protein